MESHQIIQLLTNIHINRHETIVEIHFEPTLELLPPSNASQLGDRNRGLKIISIKREGQQLIVDTQGISGESYTLNIVNCERMVKVNGAEENENKIIHSGFRGRNSYLYYGA